MSATSATSPPIPESVPYPEPTPAEHEAMFASVVWFRTHGVNEEFAKYRGMHVAIVGEEVIDADRDEDRLIQRLASFPPNRVAVIYFPTAEESLRYR